MGMLKISELTGRRRGVGGGGGGIRIWPNQASKSEWFDQLNQLQYLW